MLTRKHLKQSLDQLKLAGKLTMLIFGQNRDVKILDNICKYPEIIDILSLNIVPLVYLQPDKLFGQSTVSPPAIISSKLKEERERYDSWKAAFKNVKEIFSKNNVEYLFIKTPEFFPYTSGNLDVLVKEEDFDKAVALMERNGFYELTNIRESHKYLLKKFDTGKEIVPVHLHSRIFWGATFLDSKSIWQNKPEKLHDDVVFTLSPEDCLLTTIAHSFYENSAIRLPDLCVLKYIIQNNQLDWIYIKKVAVQNKWIDGFNIALLIYDRLHQQIYGKQLFPDKLISEVKISIQRRVILGTVVQKILRKKITMPFYLPVLLCKSLGYQKILGSQEFGGILNRTRNLLKCFFEDLFINLLKVNVQKPMLISLSGIDGSGKSSYALAIQKTLERCGLKSNTIWSRVGSIKGLQSIRKFLRRSTLASNMKVNLVDSAQQFTQMQNYIGRGWRAALWRWVNIIDFCLFYNLKIRMMLLRRHVVICDRFVPDIFIDLYTYSSNSSVFWLKILKNCLPKPAISLLLVVPVESALERSKDKDSLEYLQRQVELYDQTNKLLNMSIVETKNDFTGTCNRIIDKVLKTYYSN